MRQMTRFRILLSILLHVEVSQKTAEGIGQSHFYGVSPADGSKRPEWLHLTEKVSAGVLPSVRPLVEGGIASLSESQHLSIVFIGCNYPLQEGLKFSTRHRVSFRRNVVPSMFMAPRHRELVISCGLPGVARTRTSGFRENSNDCAHWFCTESNAAGDSYNWNKRSLILIHPFRSGGRYPIQPGKPLKNYVFEVSLKAGSATVKDKFFVDEYLTVYLVIFGNGTECCEGRPLKPINLEDPPVIVYRIWYLTNPKFREIVQTDPKKGRLPSFGIKDVRKFRDGGFAHASSMFKVPVRNDTSHMVFSAIKLRKRSDPKAVGLFILDCDKMMVS